MMKRLISFLLSAVIFFLALQFGACSGIIPLDDDSDVSGSLLENAVVEVVKYKVVFQTNGGSKISSITTDSLKEAPETTRQNHIFGGWYLDENLTVAAVFPIKLEEDITLYARWLKVSGSQKCENARIKWDDEHSSSALYSVTPSGYEWDDLARLGYRGINIAVTYDVYYTKDYDVPLDIGYMGAPKYELYLLKKDRVGKVEEDVKTPSSKTTRSIKLFVNMADIKNNNITLEFSTNNVQNIIYFKNIVVTYECCK